MAWNLQTILAGGALSVAPLRRHGLQMRRKELGHSATPEQAEPAKEATNEKMSACPTNVGLSGAEQHY